MVGVNGKNTMRPMRSTGMKLANHLTMKDTMIQMMRRGMIPAMRLKSPTRMNRSLTSKSMMRPTRPTPMPSSAYSSFVRPEAFIQLWLSWTTSRCLLLRQALEVRKARAKSQRNPPKLHRMLRVRVLRLEPSLSLAKMFVCVVAKLAIERPTALNPRALRHRAPARSVSLILVPW